MKKSSPKLIKLAEEAVETLPKALADALPAGHMAYAIKPEENGAVLISDAPSAVGHICAFVAAEHVESLPKITAKSGHCIISVSFEPDENGNEDHGLLNVSVPEGMTDEELEAVVNRAGEQTGSLEALAANLTEYGPGMAEIIKPDICLAIAR